MAHQNLFEALSRICNYNDLQSDMSEIINAVEKDKQERYMSAFGVAGLTSEELEAAAIKMSNEISGKHILSNRNEGDRFNPEQKEIPLVDFSSSIDP